MFENKKALLLNESLEIPDNTGLFEVSEDSNSLLNLRELNDLIKAEVDLQKMKRIDWLSIFNKQPTQLNNLNYKLKTNKDMENTMVIDDLQANPAIDAEKVDNELHLLSRKRKQSEGLSELRRELLEK